MVPGETPGGGPCGVQQRAGQGAGLGGELSTGHLRLQNWAGVRGQVAERLTGRAKGVSIPLLEAGSWRRILSRGTRRWIGPVLS